MVGKQYFYQIRYLIILIAVTTVLSAENTCYSIDKAQFSSNLSPDENLLVMVRTESQDNDRKGEPFEAILSFDTPRYISDATGVSLDCSRTDSKSLSACLNSETDETLMIAMEKGEVYFDFKKLTLTPLYEYTKIYYIEKKSGKHFIKGNKVPCYRSVDAIVKVNNDGNDPQKQQLIESLKNLKDIIVYDLDYNNKVAIAVGEDNSIATRKEQEEDEVYKSLILYSFDKGKHWKKNVGEDSSVRRILLLRDTNALAVTNIEGAEGVIFFTADGGKSWKNIYTGMVLYDIILHKKKIYASGYGVIVSSPSGKWRTLPLEEDHEYFDLFSPDGERLFISGYGEILFSDNGGQSWNKATLPSSVKEVALSLYKKNNLLYARNSLSNKTLLVSKGNGRKWETLPSLEEKFTDKQTVPSYDESEINQPSTETHEKKEDELMSTPEPQRQELVCYTVLDSPFFSLKKQTGRYYHDYLNNAQTGDSIVLQATESRTMSTWQQSLKKVRVETIDIKYMKVKALPGNLNYHRNDPRKNIKAYKFPVLKLTITYDPKIKQVTCQNFASTNREEFAFSGSESVVIGINSYVSNTIDEVLEHVYQQVKRDNQYHYSLSWTKEDPLP